MILPILLALILSILHLFNNRFSRFTKHYSKYVLSLSAGILITLIITELIPRLNDGVRIFSDRLYLIVLLGFISFHLVEKYAYQHIENKAKLFREITRLHYFGFFLEHFVLGFSLVLLTTNLLEGLILFLPFLLLTISSSISLEVIDTVARSKILKTVLAFSTLIGALVASSIKINMAHYYGGLSYAVGILFYIVVKDIIPIEEKHEKTTFFLIGVLIGLIPLLMSV